MMAQRRQRLGAGRRLDACDSRARPASCAAGGGSAARPRRSGWRQRLAVIIGQLTTNSGPAAIAAIARRRWCRPGPRRSPWRWRAPVRCRRAAGRRRWRDRTCRTGGRAPGRTMPGPSSRTTISTRPPARRASILDAAARRRIFGGIVEQVEQDLLGQHEVERQGRQVGRHGRARRRRSFRTGAARRSAVETRSPTSTGLALGHDHAGIEPRHVEQVADEAVEPLGLARAPCPEARRASPSS